jgi:hypothetical protein
MANIGKSDKPFKGNPNIVPGTKYDAGWLICQVPSWVRPRVDAFPVRSKTSRDSMVMFRCAVCTDGTGLCRFDRLRGGIAKSCGCLERLMDSEYQNRLITQISKIQTKDRKAIFESIILVGTHRTMELYGKSKRELDTLWRSERDRLARKFTPAIREDLHRMQQFSEPRAVAKKYQLTVGEVLYIVRVVEKAKKTAKAAAVAEWAAMPAELKAIVAMIVDQGESLIADAIELATGGHEEQAHSWFEKGRYWGELTTAEYSIGEKYSYFGWVADVVGDLHADVATQVFGKEVGKFAEIVQRTKRNRSDRQIAFLRRKSGLKAASKQSNMETAKRGLYFFPPMDYKAIASAVNTYANGCLI